MPHLSFAPSCFAALAHARALGLVRSVVLVSSLSLVFVSAPRTIAAQPSATSLTLSTMLSTVNFDEIGGRFGAIVVQGTLARRLRDGVGVEVNGFALVPGGGATADPSCLPSGPCRSYSTPSSIVGALVGPTLNVGPSGLRLSVSAGVARATGGDGFSPRATGAGAAAIEWAMRPQSRFSPSAGLRVATLRHRLAGARLLLLPGLGVTF